MREMNDSGVPWIGEIPKDWGIGYLQQIAAKEKNAVTDGPFGSDMKTDDYVEEGVPIIQLGNITPNQHKLASLKYVTPQKAAALNRHAAFPGDIVVAKMMPSGKAAIVSDQFEKYIIAADVIKIKVAPMQSNRYFCYCINAVSSIEANLGSIGATRSRINLGDGKKLKVIIPPFDEQRRIADFLDNKCAEIDAILEKTRASIEDYKKLKLSVITEAVTKGIRGDRPMKDSGVEWIGMIPSNWIICRIKHVLVSGKDGIKIGPFGSSLTNKVSGEGAYKVYGQWNIVDKDFSAGKNFVSADTFHELSAYQVFPGDVLISMMGTIGKCATIPEGICEGIMDSHVIKARLNKKIIASRFFELIYDKDNSSFVFDQMQVKKKGSIMDGLNSTIVKNLILTVPPLSEQQEIAAFLDEKCAAIDSLIASKKALITELEAYKKSIIYEYITGKKEVI